MGGIRNYWPRLECKPNENIRRLTDLGRTFNLRDVYPRDLLWATHSYFGCGETTMTRAQWGHLCRLAWLAHHEVQAIIARREGEKKAS